jgi:UDP-N-acetylglucosamine acyltransferase
MNNIVHPTAIIDSKAKLGKNNFIGPFCYIGPNVTIGDGNRFEAYVSIGTAAEHRDFFRAEPGAVVIGNDGVFREFVTINGSTHGLTQLGNNVTMLRGSHIGHDATIGDKVNLSCNVLIGGHSIISEGANLGLGAVVHQFRVIGAYSMVGMNSTVTRNVPPFVIAFGSPCEGQKVNRVGLQRSGVADADLFIFENWFFQNRDNLDSPGSISHIYQRFVERFQNDCAVHSPGHKKAA